MKNSAIKAAIDAIKTATVGITGSPSTTLEIALDITEESKTSRALGQMVFVWQEEEERQVLSLGQIAEVSTKNRWHEDQSFKGVIKRHGRLPNLSDVADNRLAVVSVQASFDCSAQTPKSHILGVSPSTGQKTDKINNEVMHLLVEQHGEAISRIGKVYGTDDVDMPMWFKHFGDDSEGIPGLGAGDAYHIGVFGKTGSGKTVTAAMMMLAYAKNKNMNVLVLDPQGQFTMDNRLLPGGEKLQEQIANAGMTLEKYNLVKDVFLPDDTQEDMSMFAGMLVSNDFVRTAFGITTKEKQDAVGECIARYFAGRKNSPDFNLRTQDPKKILTQFLGRFLRPSDDERDYLKYVYSSKEYQNRVRIDTEETLSAVENDRPDGADALNKWREIVELYSDNGGRKTNINDIVKKVAEKKGGNFVILDLRPKDGVDNENLQALFLEVIERRITAAGGRLYADNEMANCLVVMDEAHRYVNCKSPDERVRGLSERIIDAVRTTRKYGIGHMFITQSLESMDEEIIKQMRIFAFGFGLTLGSEIKKIRELVDSPAAVNLYKSFIDPGNQKRFPFMFFGPVSPLSATGAPLFVEIYNNYGDYLRANKRDE